MKRHWLKFCAFTSQILLNFASYCPFVFHNSFWEYMYPDRYILKPLKPQWVKRGVRSSRAVLVNIFSISEKVLVPILWLKKVMELLEMCLRNSYFHLTVKGHPISSILCPVIANIYMELLAEVPPKMRLSSGCDMWMIFSLFGIKKFRDPLNNKIAPKQGK